MNIAVSACFLLFWIHAGSSSNSSSTSITVESVNGKALQALYVKYQPSGGQSFPQADSFTYITGLNEAFYITRNTLFKVTFQGGVYNAPQGPLAVQIVVNDYLIIGNKVVPNSAARVNYGLDTSIYGVDILNGYYQVDSAVIGITMPVTRVAYVYLAPGVYSFNVGVRSFQSHGYVDGATATYEITQSQDANEKTIGTFPLVKTFSK